MWPAPACPRRPTTSDARVWVVLLLAATGGLAASLVRGGPHTPSRRYGRLGGDPCRQRPRKRSPSPRSDPRPWPPRLDQRRLVARGGAPYGQQRP